MSATARSSRFVFSTGLRLPLDIAKNVAHEAAATAAGQLAAAIGSAGGTVRIHDEAGRFQEERTFPRIC